MLISRLFCFSLPFFLAFISFYLSVSRHSIFVKLKENTEKNVYEEKQAKVLIKLNLSCHFMNVRFHFFLLLLLLFEGIRKINTKI
jgi:hypothetical protein